MRSQLLEEVVLVLLVFVGSATPALLTRMSRPPKPPTTVVHQPVQLPEVGDVGDDAEGRVLAVGLLDLLHHGVDAVLAEVDHRDPGALVGEQVGGRPAHAAGGTGDERPLAVDRSGQ